MPGDELSKDHLYAQNGQDEHEAQSLLSTSSEEHDLAFHPEPLPSPILPSNATNGKCHSAISQPTADGKRRTPRTMNRVRFNLEEELEDPNRISIERALSPDDSPDDTLWLEDEDYELENGGPGTHHSGQSIPLLTNIEAPSVTLATSDDFFPEDHLEDARPRSGMKMAFMNMANSIIGAGIIGQPYALRQAVDWTIRLIVINSKLSGADSFQATMQHCFGKSGLIAISVAQWAFAFGGMVAFCIIVGDTIPHVLGALFPSLQDMSFLWLLTDRRAVIVIFVLVVSYPLSLYRDIAKLAKASALALISMVVIVVTVITQGFRVPPESRGEIKSHLIFNTGFFQAVGVISFAFVCHHNSLLIYGSLKRPTLDRFTRVTHYSTGISLVMCLAMGIAGFLSFGSKTQGNVLNNFPSDNIVVNIARFCFGLNMLTTLPLEAFVCRSVMITYYFPDEPHNTVRHVIFTTALVVTSMVLSLITCDLGSVFELIGATSAAALAYIFPPLCYIKLSSATRREKIPAYLCICFGVLVMGVSLVQAVIKIIRSKSTPGNGSHWTQLNGYLVAPSTQALTFKFVFADDGEAHSCSAP
ncbi:Amino acid transporter, transmembrane [Penicillium expansum]|uniref:Amino acid transporter, transmembrane n=1 Tax=Penicillium expansum TaxID=27334 RepID=A0A0A2IAJ6_PENEN|nr:Amino acid transporter, transmembrane [Penicillium expansum]KGO40097.1 Amino acid transporter, transmembrane [Penicillium expansum]KGO46353.1 Amino acid transporter, transmembrane [Penicillium expansum]KGO53139.1 Amino acid transporter, transmembrane [Penicillium expansum]